jgi:hypothetical protein
MMHVKTLHDVAVKTEGTDCPPTAAPVPCPTCGAHAWQNCEAIRVRFFARSFSDGTGFHSATIGPRISAAPGSRRNPYCSTRSAHSIL